MRAIIVSGGNPPSKELLTSYLREDDFIIGVDKGCNALRAYGIKPNLVLGDFDSADQGVVEYYMNDNSVKVLKYNCDKDYTDTDLGYIKALEAGALEVVFFGVTGTRVDHFLGNVGILLKALRENVKAEIVDDNNRIFLVNKDTVLKGKEGETVGFHALCDVVKNFTIKDAKYELKGYDMTLLEPRAICNVFLDKDIKISFDSGVIMVIYPND